MDGPVTAPAPDKLPAYALEPRDVKALMKFLTHGDKQQKSTPLQRALGYVVTALLFVAVIYLFGALYGIDFVDILGWVLPLALTLIVFVFILQRIHFHRATKMVAGSLSIWCADDGLHFADDDTHSIIRWGAVRRIDRTPEHILVDYGYFKAIAVPTRIFDIPAQGDAFLTDLRARSPNAGAPPSGQPTAVAGKRSRWRWRKIGKGILVVFLVLFAVWTAKPWRESLDLGDGLGAVSYLTVVSEGAAADAALPLVIDLHPLGGSPELMRFVVSRRDFPARTVLPAGPIWLGIGNSWFSLDDHKMKDEVRESADRIAAFTRAMIERYPTLGKPVVTGFSQGGSLSFALAARHPDLFAAAVPVAGGLPDSVPKRAKPPAIKVRALHGADDDIVLMNWARHTVDEMRRQGWDATLRAFPGVGHESSREMGDAWRALLREFTEAQAKRGASR